MRKHRLFTIGIIVTLIALTAFTLAVWGFGWDWTGFNGGYSTITTTSTSHGTTTVTARPPGKNLWDWLQLLAALAIPVVVGFGAAWFTVQQGKVSEAENKDNQRETALQAYIDKMSELLLHEDLRKSPEDAEARRIARVRTITVLNQLDARRIGYVLAFLRESGLINIDEGKCIVNLGQANLSGTDFSKVDLTGTNFTEADLSYAHLRGADLSGANFTGANFTGADLSYARLSEADLSRADFQNANLSGATLDRASLNQGWLLQVNLSGAYLDEADLREANLGAANLSEARLSGANLSGAYLIDANLSNAQLSRYEQEFSEANLGEFNSTKLIINGANLSKADLRNANFGKANLSGADLTGAKVVSKQLDKTKSLKGATMPDGTIHP